MNALLIEQITVHEGFRAFKYHCTADKETIGYGFNIEAGISKRCARALLKEQLAEKHDELVKDISFFNELSEQRQAALINMAFQLGTKGLLGFKKMLAALSDKDYETAYREGLNSKWAKSDTPKRAEKVMRQILINEWINPN